MKKLILLIFFSGSLDSFSQVYCDTAGLELKYLKATRVSDGPMFINSGTVIWLKPIAIPDTLRATLIVYHDSDNSIVHTMPGFVVREFVKDDVYLDDRKRLIKAPMEVLTYKLKNH